MRKGVAVTLTVTLFTVGAHALRSRDVPAPVATARPPVHSTSQADSSLDEMSSSLLRFDEPAAERRDVYGNDVTDAVATYKLDASGSVYEEHSPHTELPQLKPPTS